VVGHQFQIYALDFAVINTEFGANFFTYFRVGTDKLGVFFRIHKRLVYFMWSGFKRHCLVDCFSLHFSLTPVRQACALTDIR
jgi:hypothetical protein